MLNRGIMVRIAVPVVDHTVATARAASLQCEKSSYGRSTEGKTKTTERHNKGEKTFKSTYRNDSWPRLARGLRLCGEIRPHYEKEARRTTENDDECGRKGCPAEPVT